MAQVIINKRLEEEINRRFKGKSPEVLRHLKNLAETPTKGKALGQVGGVVIKEVKYEGFRFYFVTDGHKLAIYKIEELSELLIHFVRMSDKKHQQKAIEEIKHVLRTIGLTGFT